MRYNEGRIIYKKDLLKSFIEDKKVRSCTIIGRPTKELIDKYLDKNYDLNDLYKEHNIIDSLEGDTTTLYKTSVSTYIPDWKDEYITDMCAITIKYPTVVDIDRAEDLFESVEEYYQVEVPPSMINKMIGIYSEPMSFSDILYLLPIGRQNDLAELIGKSKQLISDMKSGKSKMTLDVLRILTREYPLLPWSYFIEG